MDGYESKLDEIDKYCKDNKVKAVGLCDSNNLCGALEFSESLSKSKTQPIIGTQINIKYKNHLGKIPLFAKDLNGYKNLIKLSSKSHSQMKGYDRLIKNYGIGAQIIKNLGIKNMILVTRSKKKVVGLDGYGIKIKEQEIIK